MRYDDNYYIKKKETDLTEFTGVTVTPAEETTVTVTHYVDGEINNECSIDLDEDSLEEHLASVYPEVELPSVPVNEDGELDIDPDCELPVDYTTVSVLVDENILDDVNNNLENYPYEKESEYDEYDDSMDDFDPEERARQEAEAEDRALEEYERMCNRIGF